MAIFAAKYLSLFGRLKRAGALNVVNLIVLALGFAQQLLVVSLHGAGPDTDRYFLLIVVPQVLVNLVGNVLNNAMLPEFVAADRGGAGASALFYHYRSKVTRWALALAGVSAFSGYYQLGRLGTTSDSGVLNSPMAWVIIAALSVWPSLLSNFYATRLNAGKTYLPPLALLGLSPSLGMITGYLGRDVGVGMFLLGHLTGTVLQLWISTRLPSCQQTSLVSRPAVPIPGLGAKIGLLLVLGAGYQFLPVMERSFAALAEAGTVTTVALAGRLGGMLSPALAAGASMMLFTELADLVSQGDRARAALRLFSTLGWFQLLLCLIIVAAPALVSPALSWFVSDEVLVRRLAGVMPDYFTAGSLGACGLIVGKGCYVLLTRQYFQVGLTYFALALYFSTLYLAHEQMSLEKIALASVLFWAVGIVTVSIYLSYKCRWVGIRFICTGIGAMGLAWCVSRTIYL